MTEKRFKLDDFDSEDEMWELLNIQAEVISDMEKENKQLKKQLRNSIKLIRKDTATIFELEETIKELKGDVE